MYQMSQKEELIPPRKAAGILCVNQRTLLRWAKAGKIGSVILPSGFRRYYENEIQELAAGKFKSRPRLDPRESKK
jgi:predicted site-specific integrase-resolvase